MQILTQPTPLSGETVDDRVAALLQAGTNITLNYNDAANTLTITNSASAAPTTENIQDIVAALLVAGANVTLNYDDTANTLTINSTASGGGGAPIDAEYITGSTNVTLSAERVLTDTATITWDRSTAGQVKANAIIPASYTDEQAQDTVAAMLTAGTNVTLNYNDVANTLTINSTASGGGLDVEGAQDAVGSILTDTSTIDLTYNDATPSITASVIANSVTETHMNFNDVSTHNVSATRHGLVPKAPNIATLYLDGTGTWSAPTTTEQLQDIVATMLTDTTTIDFTYNDAAGTLATDVKDASITEAKMLLADNTTQNVSITRHGLVPKAPNSTTQYLDGTGAWSTPAGGATTFLALTDTPDVYAANALKILRVNAGATATEFGPVLGTMATQDANAVAITDGQISVGGHAPTGVLDVQGSVQASDFANNYFTARLWPVAPSASSFPTAIRLEPTAGANVATASFFGVHVVNQPAMTAAYGIFSAISSGTNRYNIYANGTAQNYFAGNVGIANSTPSYQLDVTGSVRVTGSLGMGITPFGNERAHIEFLKGSMFGLVIKPSDSDTGPGSPVIFSNVSSATIGSITTTATATAFNTSSDVRLKHAIEKLVGSLDVIRFLNPVKFRWNADDSPGEGFLAHELQQIIPAAVSGEPDALNDDGSIRPQQVDHSKLIPWLVAGLQELTARVEYLETQLGV